MHRLRPSVLLRGPDGVLRTALVIATQALFLWMFLAADPLEQAAQSEAGLRFASDWRHGMAGNSLLYMPGFFATAAALWLYNRSGDRRRVAARLLALGGIAMVAAALGAAAGARMAAGDFAAATLAVLPAVLPRPSILGAVQGLYTLATWSAFVLACRTALEERAWRPFVLPAIMTIGLALIRPWTVDDFTTLWKDRVAARDPVACASAAAVVVMVGLLAGSYQRSQSRSNPPCATGTRRAETTSSR
jgi:hypothetical protein